MISARWRRRGGWGNGRIAADGAMAGSRRRNGGRMAEWWDGDTMGEPEEFNGMKRSTMRPGIGRQNLVEREREEGVDRHPVRRNALLAHQRQYPQPLLSRTARVSTHACHAGLQKLIVCGHGGELRRAGLDH
jgi:hypothetical protein